MFKLASAWSWHWTSIQVWNDMFCCCDTSSGLDIFLVPSGAWITGFTQAVISLGFIQMDDQIPYPPGRVWVKNAGIGF